MNPPFGGSSGDTRGHGSSSGGAPLPNPFHQAPPLAQLPHHTGGLHPLHGGSGSLLHGGPPPLPPPPMPSALGQVGSNRASPHHLPGSILHPPRGGLGSSGAPSVLSNPVSNGPGGLGGGVSGAPGASSASVITSHPVRLQSSSLAQSVSQASASMKSESAYSVRPPSPRRDGGNQGVGKSGAQQQGSSMQQYAKDEADNNGGYYAAPTMSMGAPPPRHRELRVEDALLYLDQVKQQFGDQPDIYNQFLDVMKDFKAQSIDTPGVIFRVSNLFRGYPNLILGFNTFLPPGYRIRPDTSIEVIPQQLPRSVTNPSGMYKPSQSVSNANLNPVHRPPPVTIPPPYSPPNMANVKQPSSSRQTLAPGSHGMVSNKSSSSSVMKGIPKKTQGSSMQPASSSSQQQSAGGGRNSANPVEFDHAIHYVTTIKQRFADEPETYKEFLAILHTYQKEQRSIRQVLDQVSYLFREHPDLLREFTFFLPDAVQEQAKERLDAEATRAQQRKDQMNKAGKYTGHEFPRSGQFPGSRRDEYAGSSPSAVLQKRPDDDRDISRRKNRRDDDRGKAPERREKDRERDRNTILFDQKRGKRRSHDTKERRQFLALSDVLIDKEEWGIFEKIKKILPSRDSWREFLKCLELYSQEVLGRQEMLSLVKNLFGRHTELVDEFDHLLLSHGAQKDPNEIWPFIPLAETDLSQCRRATPSYRGLPASFPIPPCSFRSKMEKEVCNDSWVSVPTGSEDFSFKHMRKNQYEEALFRCEDERYEIDMAIDANASTISILEPLAREIEVLKEKEGGDEKLWNYVVDKGTFRITHLCAISRIYGEAGSQILELLRKYPAGAIPVILKRLRQKDEEWRKARQDLNKQWKEVNEENYHKSLDHSSFYFKQKDKKQTSVKHLVQEAKTALEADEKAADQKEEAKAKPDATATSTATATVAADAAQPKQESSDSSNGETKTLPAWKPHFVYQLGSVQIHKDAFGLLSYAAEKNLGHTDKEKVSKVWQSFFFPFFQLEEEWLVRKPKRANVSVEKAKSLRPGTEVSTDFGDGTVVSFDESRGVCVVNLPMGKGYLQLNTITMQESSDFPPTLAIMDDEAEAATLLQRQKSVHFSAQHEYVFVRLYEMLHSRLERAYELCEKAKRNRHKRTINPAARALDHARLASSEISNKDKTGDYQAFLSKLYALIDGSIDSTKYEDCCRTLMGSKSYFLFTMEKLVTLVLKQMQHMASDTTCQDLLKLFAEQKAIALTPDGLLDVEAILAKSKSTFEGEGAFRLEFKPGVLRRTPLELPSVAPANTETKLWAPSPRVHQPEPSKWLLPPELSIQYIGTVGDEDGDDEEEDNSPNATPPETPVFGSPEHESVDEHDAKPEKPETEQSGDESMVGASSEEEEGEEKEPSSASLKKRARTEATPSASRTTAAKRAKVDEEEKEEGEAEEENDSDHEMEDDDDTTSDNDPKAAKAASASAASANSSSDPASEDTAGEAEDAPSAEDEQ